MGTAGGAATPGGAAMAAAALGGVLALMAVLALRPVLVLMPALALAARGVGRGSAPAASPVAPVGVPVRNRLRVQIRNRLWVQVRGSAIRQVRGAEWDPPHESGGVQLGQGCLAHKKLPPPPRTLQ